MKKTKTSIEKAVDITDYFISLPDRKIILLIAMISSIAIGISLAVKEGEVTRELVSSGITNGLFYFFVPLLAFSLFLTILQIKFDHTAAIYTAANFIFLISFLLGNFFDESLAIGVAISCLVWFISSKILFNLRIAHLIPFVYLAFQFILFYISGLNLLFIIKVLVAYVVFLAGLYTVFLLMNAPLKRTFGVSATEAVSLFFAQWLKGRKDIERLFDRVGEKIETLVDVAAFKTKEGYKAVFIVPHVHYGPFGNLGGSEWPSLIPRRLSGRGRENTKYFVFHGTATHDFNPVKSDEIENVIPAIHSALNKMKYENKVSFLFGRGKECAVNIIASNSSAIAMLTRAPKTSEDLDFSIGLFLRKELNFKNIALIDAHNAETGEITRVESGSPLVFDYQNAIKNALKQKQKTKQGEILLGISTRYPKNPTIGAAGVKTAFFSFDGKKIVTILMDSNGIMPGFRNRVLEELRKLKIEAEICTTDTHSTNIEQGVLNPVGTIQSEEILREIRESVREAKENLEKVKFGISTQKIKIKAFGPKHSAELIGVINAIIATLKIAAPAIFLLCIAGAYFLVKAIR